MPITQRKKVQINKPLLVAGFTNEMGSFIHVFMCISAKITGKYDCWYMNLKQVSIRNEIFIRCDLSILNSISHVNTN